MPDDVHRKLDAILERLDAIDRRLGNSRAVGVRLEAEAAVRELIETIAAHVGPHAFAVADLLERLPPEADSTMRRAMVRAVGAASPRRVGQLLKRREGQTVAGYRIERDSVSRSGILWALVQNGT